MLSPFDVQMHTTAHRKDIERIESSMKQEHAEQQGEMLKPSLVPQEIKAAKGFDQNSIEYDNNGELENTFNTTNSILSKKARWGY